MALPHPSLLMAGAASDGHWCGGLPPSGREMCPSSTQKGRRRWKEPGVGRDLDDLGYHGNLGGATAALNCNPLSCNPLNCSPPAAVVYHIRTKLPHLSRSIPHLTLPRLSRIIPYLPLQSPKRTPLSRPLSSPRPWALPNMPQPSTIHAGVSFGGLTTASLGIGLRHRRCLAGRGALPVEAGTSCLIICERRRTGHTLQPHTHRTFAAPPACT